MATFSLRQILLYKTIGHFFPKVECVAIFVHIFFLKTYNQKCH